MSTNQRNQQKPQIERNLAQNVHCYDQKWAELVKMTEYLPSQPEEISNLDEEGLKSLKEKLEIIGMLFDEVEDCITKVFDSIEIEESFLESLDGVASLVNEGDRHRLQSTGFTGSMEELTSRVRLGCNEFGRGTKSEQTESGHTSKDLMTETPKVLTLFSTKEEQYNSVVRSMKELVEKSNGGILFSDIALLTKNKGDLEKLESTLKKNEVEYHVLKEENHWIHKYHLYFIADYLRILLDPYRNSLSILFTLPLLRGVGDIRISSVISEAITDRKPLFEVLLSKQNDPRLKLYTNAIIRAREKININNKESIKSCLLELLHNLGFMELLSRSLKGKYKPIRDDIVLFVFHAVLNRAVITCPKDQSLLSHYIDTHMASLELPTKPSKVKIGKLNSAMGLEFPIVCFLNAEDVITRRNISQAPNFDTSGFRMGDKMLFAKYTKATNLLLMSTADTRVDYPTLKRLNPEVPHYYKMENDINVTNYSKMKIQRTPESLENSIFTLQKMARRKFRFLKR
ncbi:hypothetical protein WICPIJ_005003 [Wickerhamomyces pijperi]|uniref:Uncharacterized protein n=1 Tax=Wickerhamomyces pijperi TaxID=599730 RepID=A0A9P8TM86_WICPI|nr:hypothetical protein WICPIJ_005003 [Wickerhamomyces pijperi]